MKDRQDLKDNIGTAGCLLLMILPGVLVGVLMLLYENTAIGIGILVFVVLSVLFMLSHDSYN